MLKALYVFAAQDHEGFREVREMCRGRRHAVRVITTREWFEREKLGLPLAGHITLGELIQKHPMHWSGKGARDG